MLSYKTVLIALLLSSSSWALPIQRREVPQEHSHEQFLTSVRTSLAKNNPLGIVDPVFALLGAAAAAGVSASSLCDTDCLQQATADQAFTNAKKDKDVDGMVGALIFRALERNSGTVGGTTKACESIKAVNPEIAAIQQHQDAASPNADEINKAIEIELAKQIAAVGGNPLDALKSGTFAAGDVNDPTGKGNSCDDDDDPVGCIYTKNLLTPVATEEDITAAVGDADAGDANADDNAAAEATSSAAADSAASSTTTAEASDATGGASSIGDFGICSIPQIEFAAGFDGRKETSFQPADLDSFNHGSAQAIGIITQFICDTLTNKCKADATAKATCDKAKAAAAAQEPKRGIDADAFNAVFGIATNFRDVAAIDDQGREIADSTGGDVDAAVVSGGSSSSAAADSAASSTTTAEASDATEASDSTSNASSIGDFGSCSIPEIEFAAGFDGRKETSFQPADLQSYNHGSAQAIGIITQFICDTLTNKCGADATAKATCDKAKAAAAAQPQKIGIDADAFNAVFGIATNFRDVVAIDNQGKEVEGSTGGDVEVAATDAAATANAPAATAAAPAAVGTPAPAGDNLQKFTEALGGKAAPEVVAGGSKGFVINGDEFINLNGALGRSCDVQKNLCANVANSDKNAGFSVSDCDAQAGRCRALI
ncbi:hypothetical protein MKEN_00891000 [Mycena kentingensis (nom. inval.)]|nr:hypothetical protein MKEN_00891000 [Mycena kentingensis (nom. inval.)]